MPVIARKRLCFPFFDRVHCGILSRKLHVRSVQPEKIRPDFGTDALPVVAGKRACPSATNGEPNTPNGLSAVWECHPFSKLGHWGLYDMRHSEVWQTDWRNRFQYIGIVPEDENRGKKEKPFFHTP